MIERQQRRLAAILAADIAGYSAIMGHDEARTVSDLKDHQAVVLPMIAQFGGRIIDTAGDGILAEFGSVVNAVECAVAIQKSMAERNADIDLARQMQFRIGVNLGDVFFDETRIYGDSINIAARLEGIAEPGGVCVSGKVYEDVRNKIKLTYEDIGEQQLKSISQPVRVYRLIPFSPTATRTQQKPASTRPALILPDKPSIAVLPFTNMSGDPSQEYFSDGITEDIITELSRFSELFVIARNSSFQYKGKSPDVRQVGRELGVRYVLEGSIRRSGERIRITAQLIDGATGAHRWADRYDRKLEDVFAVQDEVTQTIVTILAAHVTRAEIERTLSKSITTWQAYDYFLRAMDLFAAFWSSHKIQDLFEMRRVLDQTLSLDPNYSRAHALFANTLLHGWLFGIGTNEFRSPDILRRAEECARKAVQLDFNVPQNHVHLGAVLTWKKEFDAAMSELETATSLNSNFIDWRMATILLHAGEFSRGSKVAQTYMRVDPFYIPLVSGLLGMNYYHLKLYTEAIKVLRDWTARAPNQLLAHTNSAAAYAQLGNFADARRAIAEVSRIEPSYTIAVAKQRTAFKHEEHSEHLIDGLRKAGLPE